MINGRRRKRIRQRECKDGEMKELLEELQRREGEMQREER